MPSKTRKFDGKKYTLTGTPKRIDKDTKNWINYLRSTGNSVRVLGFGKKKEGKKTIYEYYGIYSRELTNFELKKLKLTKIQKPEAKALRELGKSDVEFGGYLDIDHKGLKKADILRGEKNYWLPFKKSSDPIEIEFHTHPRHGVHEIPSHGDISSYMNGWNYNPSRKFYIFTAKGNTILITLKDINKFKEFNDLPNKQERLKKMIDESKDQSEITEEQAKVILKEKLEKKGLSKRQINSELDSIQTYKTQMKTWYSKWRKNWKKALEKNVGVTFKYVKLSEEEIKVIEAPKRKRGKKS